MGQVVQSLVTDADAAIVQREANLTANKYIVKRVPTRSKSVQAIWNTNLRHSEDLL